MKCKINFRMFLMLFLMSSLSTMLWAQQGNAKGRVVDETGAGLTGVTVVVKGTQTGTISDVNGNYTFSNLKGNETLEYSFIGFETQEQVYKGGKLHTITLKESRQTLDNVVVVGYTSQKKSTITSAIAPVNMGDIEARRVPNVTQALQGQVAGVQVTQSTGAPGDGIEVRIRGVGTLGNNDPLYIVDGTPSTDISFLNPSDIASMSVLKDAASASIYGSRAANGVIIITTKAGTKGKTNIDVNLYTGINKVANLPHMLNAAQYMNVVEKAWNNANPGQAVNNPYTADRGRKDFADTNWLDELFETGTVNSAEVSASGGTDKTKYLMSGSLYKQNGIVVFNNDEYNKMNYRTNISSQITNRITVGTNMQVSYIVQDKLSSSGDAPGIIRHALLRPPVIPVYMDPKDPYYSAADPFTDLPFYSGSSNQADWTKYERTSNPIALAKYTNDKYEKFKLFGNLFLNYNLLKDKSLIYTMNLGLDLNFNHHKAFNKNFGSDDGSGSGVDVNTGRQNRPTGLDESRDQASTVTWNNLLKYTKTFNTDHHFSALLGSEFITYKSAALGGSRQHYDYTTSNFQYLDYGSEATNMHSGGSAEEWALMSYFSSLNYDYKGKYMATVNMRADASSKFGPNNRWGYFPSISAGWKMSDENFMKDIKWLSQLKLRGSYGALGNQNIANYAYYTTYTYSGNVFKLKRIGNPNLHWEKTTQTDFGLDFAAFNNKLYFSADYFDKYTDGILMQIPIPSIAGTFDATYVNAAAVDNKGYELNLGYRNRDHAFKYNVNANLASLTNEVKQLDSHLPSIQGQYTKTEPGHPLNAYYGYQMDGVYQNTKEITDHLWADPNASKNVHPGDIKFADLNGDGVINDKDRTYIGNPIPKFTYGINMSGEYKGFDLALFFQGVAKVDRYNDERKILNYDSRPFNYTTEVLGAWDGEGSTNSIPRVTLSDNGSSNFSSMFIEDASYFRLKNIELGYTFKNAFKSSANIHQIRLYVSAQNVFTITNYTGLDPESTALVDMGTYPQARAFMAGVNIKF